MSSLKTLAKELKVIQAHKLTSFEKSFNKLIKLSKIKKNKVFQDFAESLELIWSALECSLLMINNDKDKDKDKDKLGINDQVLICQIHCLKSYFQLIQDEDEDEDEDERTLEQSIEKLLISISGLSVDYIQEHSRCIQELNCSSKLPNLRIALLSASKSLISIQPSLSIIYKYLSLLWLDKSKLKAASVLVYAQEHIFKQVSPTQLSSFGYLSLFYSSLASSPSPPPKNLYLPILTKISVSCQQEPLELCQLQQLERPATLALSSQLTTAFCLIPHCLKLRRGQGLEEIIKRISQHVLTPLIDPELSGYCHHLLCKQAATWFTSLQTLLQKHTTPNTKPILSSSHCDLLSSFSLLLQAQKDANWSLPSSALTACLWNLSLLLLQRLSRSTSPDIEQAGLRLLSICTASTLYLSTSHKSSSDERSKARAAIIPRYLLWIKEAVEFDDVCNALEQLFSHGPTLFNFDGNEEEAYLACSSLHYYSYDSTKRKFQPSFVTHAFGPAFKDLLAVISDKDLSHVLTHLIPKKEDCCTPSYAAFLIWALKIATEPTRDVNEQLIVYLTQHPSLALYCGIADTSINDDDDDDVDWIYALERAVQKSTSLLTSKSPPPEKAEVIVSSVLEAWKSVNLPSELNMMTWSQLKVLFQELRGFISLLLSPTSSLIASLDFLWWKSFAKKNDISALCRLIMSTKTRAENDKIEVNTKAIQDDHQLALELYPAFTTFPSYFISTTSDIAASLRSRIIELCDPSTAFASSTGGLCKIQKGQIVAKANYLAADIWMNEGEYQKSFRALTKARKYWITLLPSSFEGSNDLVADEDELSFPTSYHSIFGFFQSQLSLASFYDTVIGSEFSSSYYFSRLSTLMSPHLDSPLACHFRIIQGWIQLKKGQIEEAEQHFLACAKALAGGLSKTKAKSAKTLSSIITWLYVGGPQPAVLSSSTVHASNTGLLLQALVGLACVSVRVNYSQGLLNKYFKMKDQADSLSNALAALSIEEEGKVEGWAFGTGESRRNMKSMILYQALLGGASRDEILELIHQNDNDNDSDDQNDSRGFPYSGIKTALALSLGLEKSDYDAIETKLSNSSIFTTLCCTTLVSATTLPHIHSRTYLRLAEKEEEEQQQVAYLHASLYPSAKYSMLSLLPGPINKARDLLFSPSSSAIRETILSRLNWSSSSTSSSFVDMSNAHVLSFHTQPTSESGGCSITYLQLGTLAVSSQKVWKLNEAECKLQKHLNEYKSIIQGSHETTSSSAVITTDEDKLAWWETRQALDERLDTLFESLNKSLIPKDLCSQLAKGSGKEAIVVCLDGDFIRFPLESLPVFRGRSVSRLPCIGYIPYLLDYGSQQKQRTRPSKGSYLINPKGDLKKTEETMGRLFHQQLPDWYGICGSLPSKVQMSEKLLGDSDLFVYCGHGYGRGLLTEEELRDLPCVAPSLLMGCSSGLFASKGIYEPTGMVMSYLHAGSSCVVAALWDVTDKDMDRYSCALIQDYVLEEHRTPLPGLLENAKAATKFKHLVGSAPVAYGLSIQQNFGKRKRSEEEMKSQAEAENTNENEGEKLNKKMITSPTPKQINNLKKPKTKPKPKQKPKPKAKQKPKSKTTDSLAPIVRRSRRKALTVIE